MLFPMVLGTVDRIMLSPHGWKMNISTPSVEVLGRIIYTSQPPTNVGRCDVMCRAVYAVYAVYAPDSGEIGLVPHLLLASRYNQPYASSRVE